MICKILFKLNLDDVIIFIEKYCLKKVDIFCIEKSIDQVKKIVFCLKC